MRLIIFELRWQFGRLTEPELVAAVSRQFTAQIGIEELWRILKACDYGNISFAPHLWNVEADQGKHTSDQKRSDHNHFRVVNGVSSKYSMNKTVEQHGSFGVITGGI